MVIQLLPTTEGKTPPGPTLEQVQAMVDHRGPPGTRIFDPIWLAGFRINGRKVAEYRDGRAFLAGDAAHIHSPAGGQGMNTRHAGRHELGLDAGPGGARHRP